MHLLSFWEVCVYATEGAGYSDFMGPFEDARPLYITHSLYYPHPPWRIALLPGITQPAASKKIRLAHHLYSRATWDWVIRLSGTVENESCELGRHLHHQGGRTLMCVTSHVRCLRLVLKMCEPVGREWCFFVTGWMLWMDSCIIYWSIFLIFCLFLMHSLPPHHPPHPQTPSWFLFWGSWNILEVNTGSGDNSCDCSSKAKYSLLQEAHLCTPAHCLLAGSSNPNLCFCIKRVIMAFALV